MCALPISGLFPPAQRTSSGYRVYSDSDVHRLRFVRRARDLGFPVAEIGSLLSLWGDSSRQSGDVKRLAQAHIAELQDKIDGLRQMADTLQTLIACCAGEIGRASCRERVGQYV